MSGHTGPTEQMREKMNQIMRILSEGPVNGIVLREKLGMDKEGILRVTKWLRRENKIYKTGDKRTALWHLSDGQVPPPRKRDRRTVNGRTNGVRNTRPAKSNGQVGAAVTEIREQISRKREDLDMLERTLLIIEGGLS